MDKKITIELYNFTLLHKGFSSAVKFIVIASSYVFFVLFAVMTGFLVFFEDERLFKFVGVVSAVILFNMLLRKIIGRKRPFESLGIKSIVEHKSSGSFPSNHSASSMVIAVAFLYLNCIWGSILLFMAFITGISRVFAGLHYISDVLFGFFVGGGLGVFLLFLV